MRRNEQDTHGLRKETTHPEHLDVSQGHLRAVEMEKVHQFDRFPFA